MNKKKKRGSFKKVVGIYAGLVLLLTFFSKSLYNYRLPVVSVCSPEPGKISHTVEQTVRISYAHVNSVYADFDGRIKELLAQAGDEVCKGQCIMRYEKLETGECGEVLAEEDGILTYIGVKKGMYVSFLQNTVLYEWAEKSETYTVEVFVTDEQLAYVDMESEVQIQPENKKEYFTGSIQSMIPYAGEEKSGYLAEIILHSDDAELAGQLAKVTICRESELFDTMIPKAALKKDEAGYYVLVLKEEDGVLGCGYAAHRMAVELLDSDEAYRAVRGLPAEERVILTATGEIADGSHVYYD